MILNRELYESQRQNVHLDMSAEQRLKSACAFAQSDQSLRCPREILHHWLRKCAKWRFWSDCANAQSDLNLHRTHMSEVRILTLCSCHCFLHIQIWSYIFAIQYQLSTSYKSSWKKSHNVCDSPMIIAFGSGYKSLVHNGVSCDGSKTSRRTSP